MAGNPDQFIPSHLPWPPPASETGPNRPWLGIRFVCAGAYLRIYRNPQGTAYTATCPKCARCMRFDVGPGGTNQRFFDVTC